MNKNFQHLTQYHIIGITGVIGSGKTFLSNYLQYYFQSNIIEIDCIRRNMLWNSLSPESLNLRKELIQEFSIKQYDFQFFFDRTKFTDFIFSDIKVLIYFNSICQPYFKKEIKNYIKPNQLNCITWVNLIEENYLDMIEHLVYVDISQDKWNEINKEHNLVQKRLHTQLNLVSKKRLLNNLSISYEVFNNE